MTRQRGISGLQDAADQILRNATERENGVPGVVAMVTTPEETIYEGAFGVRELGNSQQMTPDTIFAIASTTKPITGTAVMQLVEEGLLDLDEEAATFVPEIANIQVLAGFDNQGEPLLRAPKSAITVRQLMLHTAGFGYDFFNEALLRYGKAKNVPSVITNTAASLQSVLLHDPGENWEYGSSIDWAGKVVERIRDQPLSQVFQTHIFEPLEMFDTGFELSDTMFERLAPFHQRSADGTLVPQPGRPPAPEQHMGGHGLYSTVGDYMKFIRMILNGGVGSSGRILKAETVVQMKQNGLGTLKIRKLPGVIPFLSNDFEFFPGTPKSWSYSFMINDAAAPTGRPAGALGWAGLANLFFWIDPINDLGGYWATQIFPFSDPVSLNGFLEFETATYHNVRPTLLSSVTL